MRIRSTATLALIALAGVGLAACGHNMEQRVASGAVAGAIVAGPPGTVVGAAAGAVINEVDKPRRQPRSLPAGPSGVTILTTTTFVERRG